MTNLYFRTKLFCILILFLLCLVVFILIVINSIGYTIRKKKIDKYLTSIGYKRALISNAAFGDNHHYGYKRPRDDGWSDVIYDAGLDCLSISQIKKKYT